MADDRDGGISSEENAAREQQALDDLTVLSGVADTSLGETRLTVARSVDVDDARLGTLTTVHQGSEAAPQALAVAGFETGLTVSQDADAASASKIAELAPLDGTAADGGALAVDARPTPDAAVAPDVGDEAPAAPAEARITRDAGPASAPLERERQDAAEPAADAPPAAETALPAAAIADDTDTVEPDITLAAANQAPEFDAANPILIDLPDGVPELIPVPVPLSLDEGTVFRFAVNAFDPDGDALTISFVQPENGRISDNGDGTYSFTPNDLDFNGLDSFVVTVSDTSGHSVTQTVIADFTAQSDAADITAPSGFAGAEDGAIALSGISLHLESFDDAAGTSHVESLAGLSIDGLPAGSELVLNGQAISAGADGVFTLPVGAFSVGGDGFVALTGLSLVPPADYHGDFTVSLTALSQDGVAEPLSSTASFLVRIDDVADRAQVAVSPASGAEDSPIALDIAASVDSQTVTVDRVAVWGAPQGSSLFVDGELILADGDGVWSLAPDQLDGLTILPPADHDQGFILQVSATTSEGLVSTAQVPVTVDAVADGAVIDAADITVQDGVALNETLTGTAGADTLYGGGGNDTLTGGAGNDVLYGDASAGPFTVALSIEVAAAAPSESIGSITLSGLPDGAVLSAGSPQDDGSWVLSADQLDGLTATVPEATPFSLTIAVESSDGADRAVSHSALEVGFSGSAGDDSFRVLGNDGSTDTYVGGAGTDTLRGADGWSNDVVRVENNLANLSGIEAIDGGSAYDTILAGSGDDVLDFSAMTISNVEEISGGAGNDTITGTAGNDTLLGGAGNDVLNGGAGDDSFRVLGNDGSTDTYVGGAGTDTLRGADGWSNDVVRVESNLANLSGIEAIDGGSAYDTILAGSGDDVLDFSAMTISNVEEINGGAGNDTITGTAGNDTLLGGAGNDVLNGGAGDDSFRVLGNDGSTDTYVGGAGTDTLRGADGWSNDVVRVESNLANLSGIEAIDGGSAYDTILAGSGDDVLDFSAMTISNVEEISGGAGNDTITGTAGNDTLLGGAGNDVLNGGAGDDSFRVLGNDGSTDTYVGGAGTDTLRGADGWSNDVVRVENNLANLSGIEAIDGGSAYDTILAGSGDDVLDFSAMTISNVEEISGGAGNDTITGTAGNDTLLGGAGDDVLVARGAAGADSLNGGTGSDMLRVELTAAEYTAEVRAELRAFADNPAQSYSFSSLGGLKVSGVEALQVTLDGQVIDLQNPPEIATSALSGSEDTVLRGAIAASDADGDAVRFTLDQGPAHGQLSLDEDGGYVYTPDADFNGADSFAVTVTDALGATTSRTIGIDVAAVNDGPRAAESQALHGREDVSLRGRVEAADADGDALSFTLHMGPEHGSVTLDKDGSFVFNGERDWSGSDSFVVSVSDGQGGVVYQTVTVSLDGVADGASLAVSDAAGTQDTSIGLDIAARLADASETLDAVTLSNLPEGAELNRGIDNGNGTWTLSAADLDGLSVTPPEDYSGTFDLVVSVASRDGDSVSLASDASFVVTVKVAEAETVKDEAPKEEIKTVYDNTIEGTSARDLLSATDGNDMELAAGGNDTLTGSAGADWLDGGTGIDTVDYLKSATGVTATLGGSGEGGLAEGDTLVNVERIKGSNYGDSLTGDGGSNILWGYGGDDRLNGGGGNDTLTGGKGADRLEGGDGYDTASYSGSSAAVTVDLGTGKVGGGDAEGDTLSGIENLIGSSHADILTGDAGANVIKAGGGNDVLDGGGGNDVLDGGTGADRMVGGEGADTASYASSKAAVAVSLADGTGSGGDAEGDTLSGIENLTGSKYDDALVGDDGSNVLDGGAGSDKLSGGAGDDTLSGGSGDDVLDGGDGVDTVSYATNTGRIVADLDAGTSRGQGGNDSLSNIENILGGTSHDTLTGSSGDNMLSGGMGNDTLTGGAGSDTLFGGDGLDKLYGGAGDDTLTGGAGNDTLTGDDGDDTFLFGAGFAADTVSGGAGWDRIDLGGLDQGSFTIVLDNGWTSDVRLGGPEGGQFDLSGTSGTITTEDGSEIHFSGVDEVKW